MTRPVQKSGSSGAAPETTIPPIPKSVILKNGQEAPLEGTRWRFKVHPRLKKFYTLNWGLLLDVKAEDTGHTVLSERAVHLAMLYIVFVLRRSSAGFALNCYRGMLRFTRWLSGDVRHLPPDRGFEWSDLTEECFDLWLQAEYKTGREGSYAFYVRQFYRWGADPDTGYEDFSEQLSQTLDHKRLRLPQGADAVVSRDPRRGPFNRQEAGLIYNACLNGKGEETDRAVAWLLSDTGMRPYQLALLRNHDLQAFEVEDEAFREGLPVEKNVNYQLRVRIVKRRHSEEQYRLIPISEGCGHLLERIRNSDAAPDDQLFPLVWEQYNQEIIYRLERFFRDADLRSPRLSIANPETNGPRYEIMPSHPRRFRYTQATGRIAMGESPESVSDFLCHSSPLSLRSYVETTPLIADDFRRATDHAVEPLVGRMQGRIDDPENPSGAPIIPAVIPQSSRRGELRVIGSIGKCGADSHCPSNPVTGCFSCPSFIARPDAPLRELRAAVLEDMEADLADGAWPIIVELLRSTIAELDAWIEHIDRAKTAAGRTNQI